ncbi:MAG: zinc ribbon domain-containing protein [Actinobacteria bacterium]|nr:zinc ribbon domain-containing protein [Actinomycetota bacterium]
MTTYEYRCDGDGALQEAEFPLGSAPQAIACGRCGGEARRVFSAPMVGSSRRDLAAMIGRAEKSRTDPDLATSLPPASGRRRTPTAPLTPALKRLPRP